MDVSVAVIGAGAAGLAAARTLTKHGIDTLVLEARSRVGGRAYTLRTLDGAYPIELGAEFVHGNSPAIAALVRESGTLTMDVNGGSDLWDITEHVLDRVDVKAADQSVDSFLKSVNEPGADLTRMLIEGFDAAITEDASIIAVAQEWRSGANDAQSRPVDGYGELIGYLTEAVSDKIFLDTRVEQIAWKRGHAAIRATRYGEPLEIRANRVIITVPAGVLRDGLVFDPELSREKRDALDAIAMGPVLKVMLHFRSIFWDGDFFQPPGVCGFPTLWSRLPQRVPILAAWAGGDAVLRLHEKFPDPVIAALDACEQVFPQVDVRAQLQAAYVHDWQADPYAGGAYSYLRVGGGNAREVLAAPIEDTLYFAGEAASTDNYAGTVAGALETGERAALAVAAGAPLTEKSLTSDKL